MILKTIEVTPKLLQTIEDSDHWSEISLDGFIESDSHWICFKTKENEYIKGFFKNDILECLGINMEVN